jgi:hypothetical protein
MAVPRHHAMKWIGIVDIKFCVFLPMVLEGSDWSALYSRSFASREQACSTLWIGDLVRTRSDLDTVVVKRKIRATSHNKTLTVHPIARH